MVVESVPERAPGAAVLRFGTLEVVSLPAVVVVLEEGVSPPAGAQPLGPTGRSWRVPVRDVQAAVDLAAELTRTPGTQAALPDLLLPKKPLSFDDPGYPGQWYMELLEMEALWAVSEGDPDIRVAVIDSGVDIDHPDLDGGWVEPRDTYDDDDDPDRRATTTATAPPSPGSSARVPTTAPASSACAPAARSSPSACSATTAAAP